MGHDTAPCRRLTPHARRGAAPTRGVAASAPRPSPLRLRGYAARLATKVAHTLPRHRAPGSDRTNTYRSGDSYPPTLTRGGPRNGVRSKPPRRSRLPLNGPLSLAAALRETMGDAQCSLARRSHATFGTARHRVVAKQVPHWPESGRMVMGERTSAVGRSSERRRSNAGGAGVGRPIVRVVLRGSGAERASRRKQGRSTGLRSTLVHRQASAARPRNWRGAGGGSGELSVWVSTEVSLPPGRDSRDRGRWVVGTCCPSCEAGCRRCRRDARGSNGVAPAKAISETGRVAGVARTLRSGDAGCWEDVGV